MAAITQLEFEAMLACIGRLYECDSIEQFPHVALAEIPKLVGSDHSTFNYVALCVPKVVVHATFEPPDHGRREQIFSRYVSDHPFLKHYLATGDGSAHKISDFQSVREYHNLPLYQNFYHDLRYEDQLGVMLFPPGSEMIALALARDRRSFTEHDRQMLNLLRPHVARAYRHVEEVGLMKRALRQHKQASPGMRASSVLLNEQNRPVQFGEGAQQWMNHFFPDHPRIASGLPDVVEEWLTGNGRLERTKTGPVRPTEALVRERDGLRLRLRVIPGLSGSGRILVLGLETIPAAARSALTGRLTRREIEVLLQVEQGKTNDETAATLGISPYTVRTHLEHIFEKLHVPSRTAAVTRFRQFCSCVSMLAVWLAIRLLDGDFASVSLPFTMT